MEVERVPDIMEIEDLPEDMEIDLAPLSSPLPPTPAPQSPIAMRVETAVDNEQEQGNEAEDFQGRLEDIPRAYRGWGGVPGLPGDPENEENDDGDDSDTDSEGEPAPQDGDEVAPEPQAGAGVDEGWDDLRDNPQDEALGLQPQDPDDGWGNGVVQHHEPEDDGWGDVPIGGLPADQIVDGPHNPDDWVT